MYTSFFFHFSSIEYGQRAKTSTKMSFSSKQKAMAIAPKITSALSIAGSCIIVFQVLKGGRSERKRKLSTVSNRLLLGMSICDILVSACFFLTSWPIPRGTYNVYGAVGTQGTCIAQGFFSQFSIAVVMYNAMLALFYLIKIRWQWRDNRIATKVEPFMHAYALLFGIGTSAAGVALDLYNNDIWECWISPMPLDCKESWDNHGETTCIRGNNASLYRWVFYYAPLWCAILFVTVVMFLVYRAVRSVEKKNEKYLPAGVRAHRKHSKQVAEQGFWYCGAFYITWIFPTITRLTQVINHEAPYPLVIITAMFVPLQGFFNCLVYMHPRYKRERDGRRSQSSSTTSQPSSSFQMTSRSFSQKRNTDSIESRVSTEVRSRSISQSDVTVANCTKLDESVVAEENGMGKSSEELDEEPCVENERGISSEALDEEPCVVAEENETGISSEAIDEEK
jgi:hypothetical protein